MSARLDWIDRVTNQEVDYSDWSEDARRACEACGAFFDEFISMNENDSCDLKEHELGHLKHFQESLYTITNKDANFALAGSLAKLLGMSIRGAFDFERFAQAK